MSRRMQTTSVEARWFAHGELPSDVERWFRAGEPIDWSRVPSLTDSYIVLPGVDDLGIKVREGNFEVKGRRSAFGLVELKPRAHGLVETWIKWSYGREHAGSLIDLATTRSASSSLRVDVEKRRLQRWYRFARDGSPIALDRAPRRDENLDRAGFLELSRLAVDGAPSWSIAFEVFPDDSLIFEAFTKLASQALEGF